MYSKREQFLDQVGSEDALHVFNEELKSNGISIKTYTKLFVFLQHQLPAEKDKLIYLPVEKEWQRNKTKLTDAKLFGLLSELCELVRSYVEFSWEDSFFSTLLSDKPFKQMGKQMDEMESLSSLREILNCAGELLREENPSARMQWEDDPPENG